MWQELAKCCHKFLLFFFKRFRLVGRVGNAQSIADRISGSRKTTRMWQELAEKESQLVSTQLYATRILHALISTHECKYTVDINTHPVY